MGAFFNKTLLMGNLTSDPNLRYTPNGKAVCSFRIAVNRKYKDVENGELKEEVLFINIETWGKQAENCAKYISKGKSVFVEGRLKQKEWEGKDGQNKRDYIIVASNIQFLKNGKDYIDKTNVEVNDNGFSEDNLPF